MVYINEKVSQIATRLNAPLGFVASFKRTIYSNPIADKLIPAPKGKVKLIHHDGNTADTIQAMRTYIALSIPEAQAIAKHLQAATPEKSVQNVWDFIYKHFQYLEDGSYSAGHKLHNAEEVRTLAQSWKERYRGIDCDCMAVIASAILHHMHGGIAHSLRKTDYGNGWQHVYVVAHVNGKELIIDPVLNAFNTQKPYHKKKDFIMINKNRLSGFPIYGLSGTGTGNPKFVTGELLQDGPSGDFAKNENAGSGSSTGRSQSQLNKIVEEKVAAMNALNYVSNDDWRLAMMGVFSGFDGVRNQWLSNIFAQLLFDPKFGTLSAVFREQPKAQNEFNTLPQAIRTAFTVNLSKWHDQLNKLASEQLQAVTTINAFLDMIPATPNARTKSGASVARKMALLQSFNIFATPAWLVYSFPKKPTDWQDAKPLLDAEKLLGKIALPQIQDAGGFSYLGLNNNESAKYVSLVNDAFAKFVVAEKAKAIKTLDNYISYSDISDFSHISKPDEVAKNWRKIDYQMGVVSYLYKTQVLTGKQNIAWFKGQIKQYQQAWDKMNEIASTINELRDALIRTIPVILGQATSSVTYNQVKQKFDTLSQLRTDLVRNILGDGHKNTATGNTLKLDPSIPGIKKNLEDQLNQLITAPVNKYVQDVANAKRTYKDYLKSTVKPGAAKKVMFLPVRSAFLALLRLLNVNRIATRLYVGKSMSISDLSKYNGTPLQFIKEVETWNGVALKWIEGFGGEYDGLEQAVEKSWKKKTLKERVGLSGLPPTVNTFNNFNGLGDPATLSATASLILAATPLLLMMKQWISGGNVSDKTLDDIQNSLNEKDEKCEKPFFDRPISEYLNILRNMSVDNVKKEIERYLKFENGEGTGSWCNGDWVVLAAVIKEAKTIIDNANANNDSSGSGNNPNNPNPPADPPKEDEEEAMSVPVMFGIGIAGVTALFFIFKGISGGNKGLNGTHASPQPKATRKPRTTRTKKIIV